MTQELLHDAESARRIGISAQLFRLWSTRYPDFPPVEGTSIIEIKQGVYTRRHELPVRDLAKIKAWMATNNIQPPAREKKEKSRPNDLMKTFMFNTTTKALP